MATLTAGDAERVLRFVADAAQIGGDEPFTDHILVELRKLVPADSVTYCEQDRVRQRVRYEVAVPEDDGCDEIEVSYSEIAHEHRTSGALRERAGDWRRRWTPSNTPWSSMRAASSCSAAAG
jgi:hypothetical protein